MPVQTGARSGSDSSKSSNNAISNRSGIPWRDALRRFYRAYEELERPPQIGYRGQYLQRYLLTANEPLLRYVRVSLAGMAFSGMELSDDQVMETLGYQG